MGESNKVLECAKEEIVIITTSQSINRLAEDDPLVAYLRKDLKRRMMASIDLDNLEPARNWQQTTKLSMCQSAT